jgi:cellobiose-specific phosphotransferase system component IIB
VPKLTDEQAATLRDLQRQSKEAEEEEQKAAKELEDAEKAKKSAIATGSKEKVEATTERAEIARMSESSAAALTERIDAMLNLMEEVLRKQGVPQAQIDEAKKRRRPGRSA